MDIKSLRKILSKKGFLLSRKSLVKRQSSLENLYKISFASLLIISFFYILPSSYKYFSNIFKSNPEIENSSNQKLAQVLEGKFVDEKEIENNTDQDLVYQELYGEVTEEDSLETGVRLKASVLYQLFEDTKYKLSDVRINKIAKPVEIGKLPYELKEIQNVKKRKELFIQIVLPLILEENNKILLDRTKLFAILNKNNNSKSDNEWLIKKFKQYGVTKKDIPTLKRRMDIIPPSMAIAQAAKETGWGTSRFALEGNALFGQWTYTDKGIKPAAADAGTKHKVMMFNVLKSSVRAYTRNLNTHKSYKEMRYVRAIQRDNLGKLMSLELVDYLDKYAETGKEYTIILKKIIEQNSLTDFDDVKILPNSEAVKNLI
ncbi:glucosaminidase domain-containing protein [Candidatus Pelagibacter sp.]|nr:glucosaminidase domain-containing protein [Candidatus Pelagibacter sp.]